jgi:hypothetical protein
LCGKLNLVRRAFAIGISLLLGVACSSEDQHAPPLPNQYGSTPIGGGTGDGGAASGGTGPAMSGVCPMAATYDVDVDSGFKGSTSIAGTVTFASPIKAGHKIIMTLYQLEPNGGGVGGDGLYDISFQDDRMSFTYRLSNITPYDYAVEVDADVGGASAEPVDPGDMNGIYPGTAQAPIHDLKMAVRLTIPPCYSGVDFGAAPK